MHQDRPDGKRPLPICGRGRLHRRIRRGCGKNCARSPAGERPRLLSPSPRIRSESPICTSPSARSCNSASGRTNSSCGWRKANSQAEKPPSPLRHPPARLRAGNPLLRKPPLIQENHPALQEYLDAILVTADDDWLYTQDWLAGLWRPYERHPHDIHACRSPAFPHPGRPAPALHDLTERAGRNRARRLAPARFHRLRRGAVPSSRSALRCGPPGTLHGSRPHGRRSLAVVHGDGAGNARAHC